MLKSVETARTVFYCPYLCIMIQGKKMFLLFGFGFLGYFAFRSKANTSSTSNTNNTDGSKIDFRTNDMYEARSTRNNNPGNVKSVGNPEWKGVVGYDELKEPHCIFENYIWGTRAMIKDVTSKIKRGENTINKFLPIYCPKSDGCDTKKYIDFIVDKSKVSRTQNLSNIDNDTLFSILQAMSLWEGGQYKTGNKKGQWRTKFNRYFFNEALKIL